MSKKQPFELRVEFKEFLHFIRHSKLMMFGLILNVIWLVGTVSLYIYLGLEGTLNDTIITYDFDVFYTSGSVLRDDLSQLYTSSLYELPFRYLPSFAYVFASLTYLPYSLVYIGLVFVSTSIHFASTFLVYELSTKYYNISTKSRPWLKAIFIFFMAPVQVVNYLLGQISPIFIFFMLGALFFFENIKKPIYQIPRANLYGGIFIGLALMLKPFAILFLPFLIDIKIGRGTGVEKPYYINLNSTLPRILGILIILSPNIIFFLVHPGIFIDFVNINFVDTLDYHHSTSLTRIIIYGGQRLDLSIPKFTVMMILLLAFYVPIYIRFVLTPQEKVKITYFFEEALLVLLLVYSDSWFLYFVIWYAPLVPMIGDLDRFARKTDRKVQIWFFRKIAKFHMIYFSIGVVLYYVVLGYDPVTPPILLAFYLFSEHLIWKKHKYDMADGKKSSIR